ncbi:superoxide dismutase family protein [Aurantiacibacter sediminis]|uniref:Superoxide dismutase family protein n=1 Tax=Aurantiacibacter sediminis TaxID=2793064 RepID=A0ABS0N0R0_9SPHN|nr:superoxide dismutase family protein [Aurantiacibacter sediminis]MBH5321544.1 superoxide dismutase family protein [Aurantiacibacter sediminis]
MTILKQLAVPAMALLSLSGCATAYEAAATQIAEADIMNRSGQQVGTARMYSLGEEVTINVSFTGLTTGLHAVHLHTAGDCSANDFTSAGGHLNPGGQEHGTLNPRGAHLGDLPNVSIASDGAGTVSSILRGNRSMVEAALFDADGTALVVHEGPDDYSTDPAGAAGSRVACGIVTRS